MNNTTMMGGGYANGTDVPAVWLLLFAELIKFMVLLQRQISFAHNKNLINRITFYVKSKFLLIFFFGII